MLTRIRLQVLGEGTEYVDFDFGLDRRSGGFDLISATGLEPPTVDVNYSNYAMVPGGNFQSASVDARNIVVTGEIVPPPGETVLSMRRRLYHLLPARQLLVARLWRDGSYELRVNAYLETIEYSMFSKQSAIQISLICPEPYFRDPQTKFLNQRSPGSITIDNLGDAPAGLDVTFRINNNFHNTLRLFNDTTGDSLEILHPWRVDHRVRVNTSEGSREVTLRNLDGTVRQHLLGSTTINGGWPMLVQGPNELRFQSTGTGWSWDLAYVELYSGF